MLSCINETKKKYDQGIIQIGIGMNKMMMGGMMDDEFPG